MKGLYTNFYSWYLRTSYLKLQRTSRYIFIDQAWKQH